MDDDEGTVQGRREDYDQYEDKHRKEAEFRDFGQQVHSYGIDEL